MTRDTMYYSCTVIIPKKARISYKRIMGNIREHKRGGLSISETATTLKVIITAKDATAMRASVNSIIRDVQVIEGASTTQ